jgi:hypothetical protein
MPHRSVFDRFQGALERVTRRHGRERDRGSRSPQRYAEIVAAPDHGPDRAGHFHRGASLPDLLTQVTLGGSAQPLPPDRQSLWDTPAPTPSPVQSQPNASMGFRYFPWGIGKRHIPRGPAFYPNSYHYDS